MKTLESATKLQGIFHTCVFRIFKRSNDPKQTQKVYCYSVMFSVGKFPLGISNYSPKMVGTPQVEARLGASLSMACQRFGMAPSSLVERWEELVPSRESNNS